VSESDTEKIQQTFHGPVGQVAGGDIVEHHSHYYDGGRELTKQERSELNAKVNKLEAEYDEPGWKTWRFLHRTIGIKSIEAMRLGQRDSAHAILDLLLENASLQSKAGSARDLADVAIQNSNLTAQLKEWKGKCGRLERMLGEEVHRTSALRIQLEQTSALVSTHAGRFQALEGGLIAAIKKARRRLRVSLLLGLVAVAGAAFAYTQNERAKTAEARLGGCTYAGKPYAIGSVLPGNPNRECVRTKEGRQIWQPAQQKPKRPAAPKSPRPESGL